MRLFSTYLAQEWREHRSALALCVAFSAGIAVWIATYLDEFTVRVETVPLLVALQAAVLYLFVVGGSLLGSGERNAPRFFERLPRSLTAVFLAKATFFHLGLLTTIVSSLAALWFGSLALIGFTPVVGEGLGLTWSVLLLAAPALSWTLAASAWVPRPALALPMGLFKLALLASPYLGMAVRFGDRFVVEENQAIAFSCAMTLAGYPAALLAYRMARGAASRELLAGFAAVALGVVSAIPSWGWIVQSRQIPTTLEWGRDDPTGFGFTVGESGQIIIDLHGDLPWERDAEARAFALDEEAGVFRLLPHDEGQGWPPAVLGESRASAIGSRGLVYTLERDGVVETRYCDLELNRDFSSTDLRGEPGPHLHAVWIGSGSWVVQPGKGAPFFAFDPETGERQDLNWPHPDEFLGSLGLMLHDGRFLWSLQEGLFIGDPATGGFESIENPIHPWRFGFLAPYYMTAAWTRDCRPVLLGGGGTSYLLEGDRVVPGPCLEGLDGYVMQYREFADRREYLWRGFDGTIWKSDVDTGNARRLFPKGAPTGT